MTATTSTANTAPLKGFHHDDELPIKPGDTVVVPKGTKIRTMGPVREKIAGRTYTVKVNHLLNGRSFCIGYVHGGVNTPETRHACGMDRYDIEHIVKLYGGTPDRLLNHPDVVVRDGHYLFLPIEPPTVRWAGTGGYWYEVDINVVRKVEPETTEAST